jgi:hypothetical protein
LPNRILRDGILESRGVNSLSDDGQLLYYRLLSIVDDFGRYEAAEDILRAKCFPLLLDRWPLTRINAALTDVCQINALTGRTLMCFIRRMKRSTCKSTTSTRECEQRRVNGRHLTVMSPSYARRMTDLRMPRARERLRLRIRLRLRQRKSQI